MKRIISAFLFLLLSSLTYSQSDSFKLGFTGAYPNYYNYPVMSAFNWNNYKDLNMNLWQGWWIGSDIDNSSKKVLDSLSHYNIDGYFEPDSIRWAGYGRVEIINAARTNGAFKFTGRQCGTPVTEGPPFGTGQTVMYYDKNSPCNNQEPSGLVLYNVDENGFQSFTGLPYDPKYQVPFPYNCYSGYNRDTTYINTYYIKPRMRISLADTGGVDMPVVKIIVKAYNGDELISFERTINKSNFKFSDGTYDGSYLEEYKNISLQISADSLNRDRPSHDASYLSSCHVDYEIYWYGTVSFWIDYVKVMDEAAFRLFNTDPSQNIDSVISRKVRNFVTNDAGGHMKGFYMEEVDYSNLACLNKINQKLAQYSNNNRNYKMICLINPWSYQRHVKDVNMHYDEYIDMVHPSALMLAWYPIGPTTQAPVPYVPNTITSFYVPPYCQRMIQDDVSEAYGSWRTTAAAYNGWVQDIWDRTADTMKYFQNLCNSKNTPLHTVPQVHNWKEAGHETGLREPMNAELGALFCISVCYGSRGIVPYAFESGFSYSTTLQRGGNGLMWNPAPTASPIGYTFGMTDFDSTSNWGQYKRDTNFYHEPKWNYVSALYAKLKKWGPVIMNSSSTQGYSVSREGANHNYISNIISIDLSQTGENHCVQDGFQWADCPDYRYWEMGFFTPSASGPNNYIKYLMLVNRRCVPAHGSSAGDVRVLRLQFNSSGLQPYSTWKITDIYTGKSKTFLANYSGAVDLGDQPAIGNEPEDVGYFKPGEGKLLKIEPVLKSGGTLLADETISGETFTCEDTVWSNGHNITITGNSTISFTDSATIIMNGGAFQTGSASNGPVTQYNTFQGTGGHKWNGLQFNGANVKLYNAKFQDINGQVAGGNYAVTCINCPLNDIRYSNFVLGNDTAGAVNIAYTSSNDNGVYSYIKYNTFSMNGSHGRAIQIQGFAGNSAGTYIENNLLNSDGNAIGMFLSTVSSGSVRNNSLTNFIIGINASLTTLDVYGNTISNSTSVSDGIKAVSSSNINLAPSGAEYLGGFNNITSSSGASNDIEVNGSIFNINNGANTFDILSTGYHLYGTFYSGSYTSQATHNCFKISSTTIADTSQPINYVINSRNNVISYTFPTYNCSGTPPTGQTIVDIGNGMYDTIPTSNGLGGSYSSAPTPKQLYDSAHVLMMFKNYTAVKSLCYSLINTFPDSTESSEALQTLYMASVASDTSQASINALKTFYEGLILNHANNTGMVTISNYFALKCKVLLKQYSLALSGFQQIINNNPYSYDGLLARWDYMATSLLMSGGSGGENANLSPYQGETSTEGAQWGSADLNDQSDKFDKSDESDQSGDDKSPFSKEQRTAIKQSVISTLTDTRKTEEQKIDILKEKAKTGDVSAQKELGRKMNLKSVVKTEKPKNIFEHIRLVNADIQKVFGTKENYSSKNQNNVPTVFNLWQNYPNPFNPITTIKYAIPNDVKVVIKIYDILGREVKTLVNEFKKAGYYDAKFDGMNLASGVYFYRIEAGSYVNSKKMVLVK